MSRCRARLPAVFLSLGLVLPACGSNDTTAEPGPVASGAAGGAAGSGVSGNAGGLAGANALGAGGAAPTSCTPGLPASCTCANGATGRATCDPSGHPGACTCDVPAGELVCGGRTCHAGGHCTSDGRCPAFLGSCFSSTQAGTCAEECSSEGFSCAQGSCAPDGSAADGAWTWVSYPAAEQAQCLASRTPTQQAADRCDSPIWLSPSKPRDDVVRCCCRD
jgi:hypothetical protein